MTIFLLSKKKTTNHKATHKSNQPPAILTCCFLCHWQQRQSFLKPASPIYQVGTHKSLLIFKLRFFIRAKSLVGQQSIKYTFTEILPKSKFISQLYFNRCSIQEGSFGQSRRHFCHYYTYTFLYHVPLTYSYRSEWEIRKSGNEGEKSTEELFHFTHHQKMHLIRTQGSTKFFMTQDDWNVPN